MDDVYVMAQAGEEIGDLAIEGAERLAVEGAVEGAGRAAAMAAAEAVASTMFLPLEVLNLMLLTQQPDPLTEYIEDRQQIARAGVWGKIMELGTYQPYIWDRVFESEETLQGMTDQNDKEELLAYYNQMLGYDPLLFGSKVEYAQYLKDRRLGTGGWQRNFSIIAKAYAAIQKKDQEAMDKYNAQYPTDKRKQGIADGYVLGNEWDTRGGSGSFMGTDLSIQDMGIVLARQYSILRKSELEKMVAAGMNPELAKKVRLQNDKDLDYDAMKSITAAVARKEYVTDYFKTHMNTDKSGRPLYTQDAAAKYGYDRRNIPTYDAAFYAYADNHAKLGTRRDMDDLVKNHDFYTALKGYSDTLADGVYGYDPKTGEVHFYGDDYLENHDIINNTALGWTFFEKSAENKYLWAQPLEIDRAGGVSVMDLNAVKKYAAIHNKQKLDAAPMDVPQRDGFTYMSGGHDLRHGVDPVTGDIFAPEIRYGPARDFTGGTVPEHTRAAYKEWLKQHTATDPDKPLGPANGQQAKSVGPSVQPPQTHDHPPGVPNSSGSSQGDHETRDRWDGSKRAFGMDHLYGDDFMAADQLNHDVNNPIHHDSTSISSASEAQALGQMIHSRSFGTASDMASTGMNFAGLVMISDMRGQAAEKTSNALAD
jgi:hypothetical protein